MSLHPNEILLAPVVSEKSYSLIEERKYSFRVHKDAHKTQVRQAVEELFEVTVERVTSSKPDTVIQRRPGLVGLNFLRATRPEPLRRSRSRRLP